MKIETGRGVFGHGPMVMQQKAASSSGWRRLNEEYQCRRGSTLLQAQMKRAIGVAAASAGVSKAEEEKQANSLETLNG